MGGMGGAGTPTRFVSIVYRPRHHQPPDEPKRAEQEQGETYFAVMAIGIELICPHQIPLHAPAGVELVEHYGSHHPMEGYSHGRVFAPRAKTLCPVAQGPDHAVRPFWLRPR
ncbi:hypothetical protein AEB_P1924 [Altererythrobacter sp. B11]|nr:hypothetical protein AEB_P1924 [Altererythrobacter sp. B11]